MEYAKTLSYRRSTASSTPFSPKQSPKKKASEPQGGRSDGDVGDEEEDDGSADEELEDEAEWTLVEEDFDSSVSPKSYPEVAATDATTSKGR